MARRALLTSGSQACRHWSAYLAARSAALAITAVDVDVALGGARAIGRLHHRLDRRHRVRALQQLGAALPHLSHSQHKSIAMRSFEYIAQLPVEICHTPRLIHGDSWPQYVELVNIAPIIDLYCAQGPAILVTGHLGNWELLGYFMAMLGMPLHAIARPLDNKLISDWLYGIRQRKGLRIITKWGASDQMIQVLKTGRMLGFIADQNAGDHGLFVPFFGQLASTYKSIGLLAMRCNVPIVCGYAQRVDSRFRYELGVVDSIEPDDWKDQPDPLYYVTARYMKAIESMIAARPPQYLWTHRRWKSRPRFERRGEPMPARLRRNLESLPWLSEDELRRLGVRE